MAIDAATRRAFTSLVAAACIDGRVSEQEAAYLRAIRSSALHFSRQVSAGCLS